MSRIDWRHQYNEADEIHHGDITAIECLDETKTLEHFSLEADINTIVKRFGITDQAKIPVGIMDPRYYGDFSDAVDFRTSIDRIRDATERFNALPADMRRQFDNDPVQLYAFVSDPANAEKAVELGLLAKIPAPEPTPSPRRDDPPSSQSTGGSTT